MTAITFDTLKFANKLKAAGIAPAQAEAEADVLAAAFGEQRAELQALVEAQCKALEDATKRGFSEVQLRSESTLTRLEAKVDKGFAEVRGEIDKQFAKVSGEMDKQFAQVRGEMLLLKWMLGVLVAGTVALLVKSFV